MNVDVCLYPGKVRFSFNFNGMPLEIPNQRNYIFIFNANLPAQINASNILCYDKKQYIVEHSVVLHGNWHVVVTRIDIPGRNQWRNELDGLNGHGRGGVGDAPEPSTQVTA